MSNSVWLPVVIARRAYRATSSTLGRVPVMAPPRIRRGSPTMECPRSRVTSILESQLDASLERDYPMWLVLIEVDEIMPGSGRSTVARLTEILRRISSPIDIVLRYRSNALAVIVLDAAGDENGVSICRRLQRDLSRHADTLHMNIGVSTVSEKIAQSLNAGEILLSTAELNLKASKKQTAAISVLVNNSQVSYPIATY